MSQQERKGAMEAYEHAIRLCFIEDVEDGIVYRSTKPGHLIVYDIRRALEILLLEEARRGEDAKRRDADNAIQ